MTHSADKNPAGHCIKINKQLVYKLKYFKPTFVNIFNYLQNRKKTSYLTIMNIYEVLMTMVSCNHYRTVLQCSEYLFSDLSFGYFETQTLTNTDPMEIIKIAHTHIHTQTCVHLHSRFTYI